MHGTIKKKDNNAIKEIQDAKISPMAVIPISLWLLVTFRFSEAIAVINQAGDQKKHHPFYRKFSKRKRRNQKLTDDAIRAGNSRIYSKSD